MKLFIFYSSFSYHPLAWIPEALMARLLRTLEFAVLVHKAKNQICTLLGRFLGFLVGHLLINMKIIKIMHRSVMWYDAVFRGACFILFNMVGNWIIGGLIVCVGNVYLVGDLELKYFLRDFKDFSTKYELWNGTIRWSFRSSYFLMLLFKNLCILWAVWDINWWLHGS